MSDTLSDTVVSPLGTDFVQKPFRAPQKLHDLLSECAERHGRSCAAELRMAAEAWVHTSVLAGLLDPEVQAHLGPGGVVAYRERATTELRALYARAFPDFAFLQDFYAGFRDEESTA